MGTPEKQKVLFDERSSRSASPSANAPGEAAAVELKSDWGTKQRIKAVVETTADEDIDELIDRMTRMGGGPKFITNFHPQATWLWRQWKGTVLEQTWQASVAVMVLSAFFCASMEANRTWPLLALPPETNDIVMYLRGLNASWGYLLTMAGFTNSFFLSQAYGFWLANKGNVRKLQGRINDVGMLLAAHGVRDETGKYTPAVRALLEDFARWARLYNILFWANQVRPARADEGASLSLLRTDRGMARLLERNIVTEHEHELLVDKLTMPPSQRPAVILMWITRRIVEARKNQLLEGGAGMESVTLDKLCLLRATCASITDDAAGRMPLAYVHLVQILVDALVILAPFSLYSRLGLFVVPVCGLLTIFYRGFVVLSKSFLDPFGNEDSLSENFSIQCLVNETNSGSVRWRDGIEETPFDSLGNPRQVNSVSRTVAKSLHLRFDSASK